MKKIKKIPKFKTPEEESDFWNKHDSSDYIDWSKAKRVTFPKLKPSTITISLRLPEILLNQIRVLANKDDVPYQSFMKMLLIQGVNSIRKQEGRSK